MTRAASSRSCCGVTASSKTEVYLRAARAAPRRRRAGARARAEVALGSQIVERFRSSSAAVGTAAFVPRRRPARRRNWELARRGALDVVVGARSAVFAPLPNLKVIVVDEEHEGAVQTEREAAALSRARRGGGSALDLAFRSCSARPRWRSNRWPTPRAAKYAWLALPTAWTSAAPDRASWTCGARTRRAGS